MRHTRTADSVGVGDTVVDADDEPRTVIAITHVDRSWNRSTEGQRRLRDVPLR